MEQTAYTILYIDDDCNRYLPLLKPAAQAAGFSLSAADNVLDGLEYLKEYAGTVHAIILDLSFPKGELQGAEALQKIKQKYSLLPVIMLTDSDTAADIDRVVECMKKGAYNYVGKRTLNPVYLFQVVETAIQQQQLQIRLAAKAPADKTGDFFVVTQPCDYGRFKQSASFGFQLVSINKAGNETELTILNKTVAEWHENLLKSVSVIYRDEVQLNLKYIAEGGKTKCCIIFTVLAMNNTSLQTLLQNLQHDIAVFFTSAIDSTHPYLFEVIGDEVFLKDATIYPSNYIYNVFYRKPLKVNGGSAIGFTAQESKDDSGYNPDEIFHLPAPVAFDNELFRALLNQLEYAEIDVQLMPRELLREEIDLIKQVIKNTSSIQGNPLSAEEQRALAAHLQKFITTTNDKFMVSVILKRNSTNWEQHLKSGIINYFFGNGVPVGYQQRKPETLYRFKIDEKGKPNQLPFMYSIAGALQAFRLPVPGLRDLPGFTEKPHIFHALPGNLPAAGVLLGEKNSIQSKQEIRIAQEALARHLYIMGQTGTGKSTLLKTMITDCLKNNEGFAVIDPHGDLFDEVQKLIPKTKKKKLFILNPMDAEHSVALNPLQYNEDEPQAKSLIINELIRIFSSLYDMKRIGGSGFESYFKNGLLLMMDDGVKKRFGSLTLADFAMVFHNDDFREELLKACTDKTIKNFFKLALASTGEQVFANWAIYVTGKLTRFVEDYYLSPLITGKKSNIDFRKLLDDGNILLVKMDKGLIGTDNTSLLGQIVLGNIIRAGMGRTGTAKEERKPYNIFIDEFQNFIKSDAATALSEVRKYGLRLILANQTLGQLDDFTIQSLLGNVGSLVFFRPGINDYEKIKHYLEPEFKREDVLKLPNFNCIARLLIDNVPSDPFVFQTKNE